MRCYAVLLSAAVTLALAAGADARDRTFVGPHLRPLDQASAALMADAQQRSETMRNLVKKLEASNVVAYVHIAPRATGDPESGLRFVGTSKMARFVLIAISGDTTADRKIERLGHELQHAVEIAGTPWVQNDAQVTMLMSFLGRRDWASACGYETSAANRTERQVRRDLGAAAGTQ